MRTPRPPRYLIETPVELLLDKGGTNDGYARNVSETGVLAHLRNPVSVGTLGTLCARLGNVSVCVRVRVVHSDFLEAGLTFVTTSEQERQLLRIFTRLASR